MLPYTSDAILFYPILRVAGTVLISTGIFLIDPSPGLTGGRRTPRPKRRNRINTSGDI